MKPVILSGRVVRGYGRGSRELGCPTANIDEESVKWHLPKDFKYGIYYGWAKLITESSPTEGASQIYKMVASVGMCPFYKNKSISVEVHLIHQFRDDFYGATLKIMFLGFLREEKNFDSIDELIAAIREDVEKTKLALQATECQAMKDDPFFTK
ncbi:riboflavin kinase-like [Tropilaelaps mercedesae]|uniref:riboflavin kinase n=1 Tax=Tropilaelaps mercedesae TaxID=418985 RepID=A0A1V9XWU2_9ACAR|nr:riboflavin kinase-like [Tropilaelaps mercedesae]